MSTLPQLDRLLKKQVPVSDRTDVHGLLDYAAKVARLENAIAVVSDLRKGTSRIFTGRIGHLLGINGYEEEDSIWEKAILDLMPEKEREEKYRAELRFFNFLRHIPRRSRPDYYLASKISFIFPPDNRINILHRMFYIYDADNDAVTHALCLYAVSPFDFAGKSIAVNSLNGVTEELTSTHDASILSKRELQVLRLIDAGRKSAEIAALLSISRNTVSRHRQHILSKMQVRNSVEACRMAKSINLI